MSKRHQVVTASALTVLGLSLVAMKFVGSQSLNAASVGQMGVDLTNYFLWGGVALLVVSALLYIRASAE